MPRQIIGNSPQIQKIKTQISRIARTDATVLITGATGTGKDLAAEHIHHQSQRSNKPFICVDCTTMPENLVECELFGHEKGAFTGASGIRPGKFEWAAGGTIFLDEIGDMPLASQSKLLRVIEKKAAPRIGGNRSIPFDVRVIAATNKNMKQAVDEGRFRMDLYYRLNIAELYMPSLCERKSDIPLLIRFFVGQLNQRYCQAVTGVSEDDLRFMYRYHWPGNVRELKNIIENAFINHADPAAPLLTLPRSIRKKMNIIPSQDKEERLAIVSALMTHKWNKSQTARKLNWSRMTLYRKIKKYNIVENRSPAR